MISYLATCIELIYKYRAWGVLLIFIGIFYYLLRVILDEDRSAAWRARIYKAVYKISGKSEAEKKYIENDISSRINLSRHNMPFGKEYLPKAIKVEWFKGMEGGTAQIKENEIIVRLDSAESQEKNTVLLAGALVKRTSLTGIRHILKEPLELSMDLNLIKNLLTEIGDRRVLDWFFRNEYQPNVNKSEEIKEWNGKIVEIDEKGLFTRLLLVELDDYSKRIIGKPGSSKMFHEIAELVDFLYRMSTKAYAQEVPLDLITQNIKIGIILVGETSKILSGIENYLTAFAYNIEKQLTSIYVIIWDKEFLGNVDPEAHKKFVEMTEGLDRGIQKTFRVPRDFELKYTCTDHEGNKRKAKISHYIPEYVSL